MDLRQLRYFLAVAEAGHITRAAERLGMQQPPLSQQIKALEGRLGLTLFERHAKGVALTDAGRLLQDEARRLVGQADTLQRRMAQVAAGRQGPLQLGFTSSAAAHAFLPRVLRECRQQYPGIRLELAEFNAAELTEAVQEARLHCGFLRVPVAAPEGLEFETLFDEPALLVLPNDHPAVPADGGAVPLAALRDDGFILVRRPGAPGLYAELLVLCRHAGFEPRVVAEVPRMLTNLNLVAAGAGVSVVPASMRGVHAHALAYCDIAELPGTRPLRAPMTLVSRRAEPVGPTATFLALVRELNQAVFTAAG
ncbi:LysR family transcriptional regulator [Roseateles sp.]|uniref:LysR family transcriptional regulator n=1 Tax=Roseateles sp. TaxID=1971397 RepID=UPI0025E6A71E|nr:LysR family transcriptional regulator [Roseateles sp.]MBV8035573.1 LysR family transcriptional regulator [Roseateles sp.]